MHPSVAALNLSIFWRDRNVPPIGLTVFFDPLAKARSLFYSLLIPPLGYLF
jgi:hypothetical protein